MAIGLINVHVTRTAKLTIDDYENYLIIAIAGRYRIRYATADATVPQIDLINISYSIVRYHLTDMDPSYDL